MNLDLSYLLDDVSPREARVLDRIAVDVAAAQQQAVEDARDAARVARVQGAAMDLLAACESIVAYYQNMSGNPSQPVSDRYWLDGALLARAAIAKARGAK